MDLYNLNNELHYQDLATVKSSVCSEYPQFRICHSEDSEIKTEDIDFLWLNDDFARDFCMNTEDACNETR